MQPWPQKSQTLALVLKMLSWSKIPALHLINVGILRGRTNIYKAEILHKITRYLDLARIISTGTENVKLCFIFVTTYGSKILQMHITNMRYDTVQCFFLCFFER